jgi:hypothetical protein
MMAASLEWIESAGLRRTTTAPRKRKANAPELELHPDAWERFTEFVKRIAKAGPQHRPGKKGDAGRSGRTRKSKAGPQ